MYAERETAIGVQVVCGPVIVVKSTGEVEYGVVSVLANMDTRKDAVSIFQTQKVKTGAEPDKVIAGKKRSVATIDPDRTKKRPPPV